MTKVVWGSVARLAAATALAMATTSCGDLTRQGTASSYLIITTLEGSSGDSGTFTGTLSSDIVAVKNNVSSTFVDLGRVQFALGLKDPGPTTAPTSPSQANFITVDRYRVKYIRTDGRNVEGVDVPYAFDGAFTATVAGSTTVNFTLVRIQAKEEAPLRALLANNLVISTIAEVTFYGHDQTGRAVSVTGNIGINFANFADAT